jgi:phosphocarrier protein HPr
MQQNQLTIINKLGLHARAAAKLVQAASRFESEINITVNNKTVNGKSIMGIMMLAASKGTVIEITSSGADENDAMEEIVTLINNRFGENE